MNADFPKTDKTNRAEIYILLLCLLIGFALRYYTFDQKSLWLDEIYTYNDARYGLNDQLKYFQEKPNYLQSPLFFVLAHLFYPTTKPERDLRIIPLIFGALSIPMIYFLAGSFSPGIALPCTLSLAFMTYHISLSQDARSYAMLMFFGMAGLYFFMKHLKTSKKRYLLLVALFFAVLLHTSYSSIPFMALSQILWFYRVNEGDQKPRFPSFLILNGLILFFCLPWILFLLFNYRGQPMIGHLSRQDFGSFSNILYGILHDWAPHAPLMMASVILFILFPFSSKFRKNALVLLAVFILPIGGLYLYCKLLNLGHFITSRYFVNFLPLFLITLYLSLKATEERFKWLKQSMRLSLLFVILFIASNLVILPFYYRAEKQDFRSLVNYLKGQLRDGDKIIVGTELYIPGMLHYFGVHPEGRLYLIPSRKVPGGETEHIVPLVIQNKKITISYSKTYWHQYVADGNRVWMVVNKMTAKAIKQNSIFVLKGYFDGSFLNFIRFPIDASMYLFIWDPLSPEDKGIEIPID